jgi:hypothetical protein
MYAVEYVEMGKGQEDPEEFLTRLMCYIWVGPLLVVYSNMI